MPYDESGRWYDDNKKYEFEDPDSGYTPSHGMRGPDFQDILGFGRTDYSIGGSKQGGGFRFDEGGDVDYGQIGMYSDLIDMLMLGDVYGSGSGDKGYRKDALMYELLNTLTRGSKGVEGNIYGDLSQVDSELIDIMAGREQGANKDMYKSIFDALAMSGDFIQSPYELKSKYDRNLEDIKIEGEKGIDEKMATGKQNIYAQLTGGLRTGADSARKDYLSDIRDVRGGIQSNIGALEKHIEDEYTSGKAKWFDALTGKLT